MPLFPREALLRCRLFVHDLHATHEYRLPEQLLPPSWQHNQYAAELWVQRALRSHPWRVPTADAADLIVVAANFSLYCVVSMYKQRALWKVLVDDKLLFPLTAANRSAHKFLTMQYAGCKPPWIGSRKPSDIILLKEHVPTHSQKAVVSPFVVSRPDWLTGVASTREPTLPWAKRKLLFFAGHVPKPYIRVTRYLIWRQCRRDPRVTAISSTLSCQIGTFAKCDQPIAQLAKENNSFWLTHCRAFCGPKTTCMSSARRKPKANMQGFLKACARMRSPRLIQGVNFSEELPDILRDTRKVSHSEYLSMAMNHRFCLIAPGDWVSTHKVTEAMAIGGSGGCIPVFVVPGRSLSDMENFAATMLPYTRWHDYCSTSYFVTEFGAKLNFSRTLERLDAIGDVEATMKWKHLKQVKDAFVFRDDSTYEKPTAPHFILGEACAAARCARAGAACSLPPRMNLSACALDRKSEQPIR